MILQYRSFTIFLDFQVELWYVIISAQSHYQTLFALIIYFGLFMENMEQPNNILNDKIDQYQGSD